MPEIEDEERNVEEDLDALLDAIEALEANGLDADPQKLRDAAAVYDGPIELADEEIADGDEEKEEARDYLAEGRDALLTIADGEGTEDDVETALERTSVIHQQITMLALKAALGL